MEFKDEIILFEEYDDGADYVMKSGNVPVLFTAVHTMMQSFDDGSTKLAEPFTKAICLYMNKHCNTFSFVKVKDTGIDSNKDNEDDYKKQLFEIISEYNIKLVIDLHGANRYRDFDVEFGTMNNLSADFSTIRELEDAFKENGITNVIHNDPFKGGAITQSLFSFKDVDVIQLEINRKYRDINDIEYLQMLCNSLEKFIKQYVDYIK